MDEKKMEDGCGRTKWITAEQLMELYPMFDSKRAISYQVKEGYLKAYRVGKKLVFDEAEVEAAIRSRPV